MRPAHVYARIPAEQHTELITALHGPWRTATRMVIIVLSAAGWPASEIADLLHYDPKTVRRLIRHRDPKKRLSAKKVGGQWRIPPSAVISLLERDIDP